MTAHAVAAAGPDAETTGEPFPLDAGASDRTCKMPGALSRRTAAVQDASPGTVEACRTTRRRVGGRWVARHFLQGQVPRCHRAVPGRLSDRCGLVARLSRGALHGLGSLVRLDLVDGLL